MSEPNLLIEYFNSNPFLYEFDNGQVRLFTCKKKMLYVLMQTVAFYETIKSLVHGFLNSNDLRLYLSDFLTTWSSFQNVFNFSIIVPYFMLIRLSFYLLPNANQKSSKKFQYLNFLRFNNERDLVKQQHFTFREARNYLRTRRFFFNLVKHNMPGYCIGCSFIVLRVVVAAYSTIPFRWFLLSTLPNSISLLFAIISTYSVFNCFNLSFWSACTYCFFRMKSLSHHKPFLCSFGAKLDQKKLRSISKVALIGFNETIVFFKSSMSDFNYTICECLNFKLYTDLKSILSPNFNSI